MNTVPEIFEKMPESFQPEAAAGMNAVVLFDVTGDGGGKWYAAIDDGKLDVVNGEPDNPDLTITVKAQDYIDISSGKLNEQLAFMTGKITAKGDMTLAFKLQKIFKR